MIKPVILKVKPGTRFHFGKVGTDINSSLADTDEWLHSDVLFSAIINNIASVDKGELVDQIVQCFKNGKIKISSGFYCIIDNQNTIEYLLPKPVSATTFIQDYSKIKPIKKVQFISHKLWNICPDQWENKGVFSGDKKILLDNSRQIKVPSLYQKVVNPNLVIHKPFEDSKGPILLSTIQIPELIDKSIHFYFLYELQDGLSAELQEAFKFAVDLIEFNGLGGERSSGCGNIDEINWKSEAFPIHNENTGFISNMGLLIPTEPEFNQCLYYEYKTRGGRRTKHSGTLKRVRMLKEGAVINSSNPISGQTVQLDKNGQYLRYGQPLCLTIPQFYSNEKSN